MMKITIFNGPVKEFEKIVPIKNTITLTPMVRIMDLLNKPNEVSEDTPIQGYEALIVYSDEYSGVADHFVEAFLIYILNYATLFDYTEVYLHNPPIKILNQIKNSHLELDLKVIGFKYKKTTLIHLSKIKRDFDKEIHGQEKVKLEILRTIYTLTNKGQHKPVIIMLYGPSSVGKTETAKLINTIINGKKELFRKQLSMYHNESFSAYIFGNKSNSFAKDLIDRETNVLLLDEFDKANPMFYSAFYQMFDEGKFTDKFYEVDLKNTIVFCTSNYQNQKEIKDRLGNAIFSRFDSFIEYAPLSTEAKKKIIETTYKFELAKFNEIDKAIIEKDDLIIKLHRLSGSFQNAREIQKIIKQTMANRLIDKL